MDVRTISSVLEGTLEEFFAATSQASTCHLCGWEPCVGVRRAMALIGNAKQATSEGKSGPVETGLTGPAATAMTCALHVNHINYCWTVHEYSQLAPPSSHSFPCPLAQKTRSPLAVPLSAGSPKAW